MSSRLKTLFGLHLLLMVYSVSGILSKLAAGEPFLSPRFCLLYAGLIGLLGLYAIGWQQVLKRLPLTTAYSNRAVAIVWGIIWGALLFAEPITPTKIIGGLLIIVGVVLFSYADAQGDDQGKGQDKGQGDAQDKGQGANQDALPDGETSPAPSASQGGVSNG